jgi:choice-of-anchor A domain-containing protein
MSEIAADLLHSYNLITTGDVSTNSDVEGSAVIGGTLTGATFFNNSQNWPQNPVVYTYGYQYGNLNLNAGTLYLEKDHKGGNINANGAHVIYSAPPSPLSTYTDPLTALSTQLAGAATTAGSHIILDVGNGTSNSVIFDTGANTVGDVIFNISAADLQYDFSQASNIKFNIENSGVTSVTINVTGGSFYEPTNINWNGPAQQKVLFNFVNATSVSVGNWEASIVAPSAAVSIHSGNIEGSVFAASFGGGGEIHNLPFNGTFCFLSGTHIRTPTGETMVESLTRGDLVVTADGRTLPVRWVGINTVSTVFADPLRVLPIRIRQGALADNVPSRDLLLSPDHAVLIDDILIQAGALVNGVSIIRETNMPTTFVYYHIEVEDHSLILAEGAPAETFVDNVDRMAFDNWDEYLELFGEGVAIPEMDYPRAKSARQVPRAVRALLAARQIGFAEVLPAAA